MLLFLAWSALALEPVARLGPAHVGHFEPVDVVVRAEAGELVTVGQHGELVAWDLERKAPVRRVHHLEDYADHLVLAPDGALLAQASKVVRGGDRDPSNACAV